MPGHSPRYRACGARDTAVSDQATLHSVVASRSYAGRRCALPCTPPALYLGPRVAQNTSQPAPDVGGAPPSHTLPERLSEHFEPSRGRGARWPLSPTLRFANRYRSWLAKLPHTLDDMIRLDWEEALRPPPKPSTRNAHYARFVAASRGYAGRRYALPCTPPVSYPGPRCAQNTSRTSPDLGGAPPSQTHPERRSEHFAPLRGNGARWPPSPTLRFANRYRSWLAKLPQPLDDMI